MTEWSKLRLAGTPTDLLEADEAVAVIMDAAADPIGAVLGVVSVNLDHVHHFGSSTGADRRRPTLDFQGTSEIRWLSLLDGAPLAARARRLTGRAWPRLAGSDLITPIIDAAETRGLSLGFLGGSAETHRDLIPALAARWPELRMSGCWAPERADLEDPAMAAELTRTIHEAGTDILVVCLGKPRQERWIADHGPASGARVCLAFGAVVDFLAGRVQRAPRWVADRGFEWAWRLAMEPRRLARRYLVQGPPSYLALRRDSGVVSAVTPQDPAADGVPSTTTTRRFSPPDEHAEVAALVVTYNNADDVEALVASLRGQLAEQTIRVVVVDNSSSDDTVASLQRHDDILVVPSGGNLGYAGGLNLGLRHVGDADAVLILNPDIELATGSVDALRRCQRELHAAVVVPQLLDTDGSLYKSLRREPSKVAALGDALFGEKLSRRPAVLSEIEHSPEAYQHRHRVDWATGAVLLIDRATCGLVGDWDERYFLYSEETDFMHRVRVTGGEIWYEPRAVVRHRRGGSGSSSELEALMAVNRVRYQEKWYGRQPLFRLAVTLNSLLRLWQPRHRVSAGYLVSRRRWADLPQAEKPDAREQR